jgi:hypothetical protein
LNHWFTKNAFSRCEFLQVLMGIFYYVKSVALSEDLAIDHAAAHTAEAFYMAAERSYTQVCTNSKRTYKIASSPIADFMLI